MPLSAYVRSLTDTQLIRFDRQLRARLHARDGYQPYGYDRRTLGCSWVVLFDAIIAETLARPATMYLTGRP